MTQAAGLQCSGTGLVRSVTCLSSGRKAASPADRMTEVRLCTVRDHNDRGRSRALEHVVLPLSTCHSALTVHQRGALYRSMVLLFVNGKPDYTRTRVPFLAPCSPCCVREAAVFCGAMATGGGSLTTISGPWAGPAGGWSVPAVAPQAQDLTVSQSEVLDLCVGWAAA